MVGSGYIANVQTKNTDRTDTMQLLNQYQLNVIVIWSPWNYKQNLQVSCKVYWKKKVFWKHEKN